MKGQADIKFLLLIGEHDFPLSGFCHPWRCSTAALFVIGSSLFFLSEQIPSLGLLHICQCHCSHAFVAPDTWTAAAVKPFWKEGPNSILLEPLILELPLRVGEASLDQLSRRSRASRRVVSDLSTTFQESCRWSRFFCSIALVSISISISQSTCRETNGLKLTHSNFY